MVDINLQDYLIHSFQKLWNGTTYTCRSNQLCYDGFTITGVKLFLLTQFDSRRKIYINFLKLMDLERNVETDLPTFPSFICAVFLQVAAATERWVEGEGYIFRENYTTTLRQAKLASTWVLHISKWLWLLLSVNSYNQLICIWIF